MNVIYVLISVTIVTKKYAIIVSKVTIGMNRKRYARHAHGKTVVYALKISA